MNRPVTAVQELAMARDLDPVMRIVHLDSAALTGLTALHSCCTMVTCASMPMKMRSVRCGGQLRSHGDVGFFPLPSNLSPYSSHKMFMYP